MLLCLVWLTVSTANVCQCDEFELSLYKHLLKNYNKDIRPTRNYRITTNITFGFSLHQIIDVDERNQLLTTSSWLNINWLDQRLEWNRSNFGDIESIHMPADRVWKPDVMLFNNADPEYKETVVSTDVSVTEEGNLTWLAFGIFRSSCQIDVRYYPFDDQVMTSKILACTLVFSSWSYDIKEINITTTTEEGDMSNFIASGEWQLLSITAEREVQNYVCCDNAWPIIIITLKIRRRPLFYVFNHIMPCGLITSMALLGFYIPASSGEKVTLCITTMLSMGVFLNAINEKMPPSGESLPLIGMYYSVCFCIVCVVTVINVLILNLHRVGSCHSPRPVPPWMRKLVFDYMGKMLLLGNKLGKISSLRSMKKRLRKKREKRTIADALEFTPGLELPILLPLKQPKDAMAKSLSTPPPPPPPLPAPEKTSWSTKNCGTFPTPPQIVLKHGQDRSGITRASNQEPMKPPDSTAKSDLPFKRARFNRLPAEMENKLIELMEKVNATMEHSERRQRKEDERNLIKWEWKTFASVIDRLLLVIFITTLIWVTVAMLVEPVIRQVSNFESNDSWIHPGQVV